MAGICLSPVNRGKLHLFPYLLLFASSLRDRFFPFSTPCPIASPLLLLSPTPSHEGLAFSLHPYMKWEERSQKRMYVVGVSYLNFPVHFLKSVMHSFYIEKIK